MIDSIEAVSYLAVALYLLHLGRRLQREQEAEDAKLPDAPPLSAIEGAAPGFRIPTVENRETGGGISHPERLRLERAR